MIRFLKLIVFAMLVSCGGGGGVGTDIFVPAPAALRTDLLFGYYGAWRDASYSSVAETKAHTNLLWEAQFNGPDAAIDNIVAAQMATVIDVSPQVYLRDGKKHCTHPNAEANLRQFLAQAQARDALRYVVALAPIDEPDINVSCMSEIVKVNLLIRRVAMEFDVLKDVKLAVIYTASRGFPFMEDFDWIGFDDYDMKSEIFVNGQYQSLVSKLLPHQRTLLIPGGAFGQDITPFVRYAHTHQEVVAVVAFLWIDTTDFKGIRSLPNKLAYCLAGEQIKSPHQTGACN